MRSNPISKSLGSIRHQREMPFSSVPTPQDCDPGHHSMIRSRDSAGETGQTYLTDTGDVTSHASFPVILERSSLSDINLPQRTGPKLAR